MARATAEQTDELMDLWGRLERLKTSIGGWVITAASMPAFTPEAIQADDRIREATQQALDVKTRITQLSPQSDSPTAM